MAIGPRVLFVVFPKSGTGLLHTIRGIKHHVNMFDGSGQFQTSSEYIRRTFECDQCTGHIPYSPEFHEAIMREQYRTVFIFRNLRDVAVSLVSYVYMKPGSELNVMVRGTRLSRCADPLMEAIGVVAGWWEKFSPWLARADALYTYRELRGAALLIGHEEESLTFDHGNINEWHRVFKPHHLQAARKLLPDVLREYNLAGIYDE